MEYSAVKAAKELAATYGVKLSEKQHKKFVEALAKALVEAHNAGYRKGHDAAEYDDSK
jgi:hypothetical protein